MNEWKKKKRRRNLSWPLSQISHWRQCISQREREREGEREGE